MDYVKDMRLKVGQDTLILVASNVILYDEDGNYYFQKRPDGKLAFVGGFVEINESVLEGLIREVKEEIDLDLVTERLEFHGMYTKYQMQYANGDKVKPHSMFFKYKLDKNDKFKAVPPETIEIVKSKLHKELPMLNIQHYDVLMNLIENKNEVIIQ